MTPSPSPSPKKKRGSNKHQLFAPCAPGLEDLVAEELKQLSAGNITIEEGGVSFTGTIETIIRANLQLRIAERVLLRLASFPAKHMVHLEEHTAEVDFAPYIAPQTDVYVSAVCKKSKIYHSGAAAERVAKSIAAQIPLNRVPTCQAAPPENAKKFALIQLRLTHDTAVLSIDTSGALLHKRGYRTHVTPAPMRETIAAAALRFCGYNGENPLVDPMCGSGTFPIEAALLASRTAPGSERTFAFEHWPSLDSANSANAAQFTAEKERAAHYARSVNASIIGSDVDARAIKAAVHNATAAKTISSISFSTAEISKISLPSSPSGLIICNPPWNKRLKDDDVLGLYRQLGDLRRSAPNWQLCVLTSSAKLARACGVEFTKVSNAVPVGGIRIKFYLG